tara:strand:- start:15 stop:320 length:306 start_codon:yes stop_codon:yes gene_type:complete
MSVEKCNLCGFCKAGCPIYRLSSRETKSPRGLMILIKEKKINKIFNSCLLCKSCEKECPASVEITKEVRKAREKLILNLIENSTNKKMKENIETLGNVYGI